MVRFRLIAASLLLARIAGAQASDTTPARTFLVRRDLAIAGAALGSVAALSLVDDRIARASQRTRRKDPVTGEDLDFLSSASTKASKVNETTLTAAGILIYGAGRLFHSPLVTDVALHATESVVLASLASQVIRGPLGRTRPYVTHDSDQYKFRPFHGFFGDSTFDNRAFPSIHESSSMAVATVLVMETQRRNPGATWIVAPIAFGAALIPGLARIRLDQHWTSDIAAGAFMGAFSAYKVVSYSHSHPNNRFDQLFLTATLAPAPHGGFLVAFSPSF